jgi:ribulose-phosphate 3-epimerase
MQLPIIAPSILSADMAFLGRDLEMINQSKADWVHVDVMDGVFVPNISLGFPVIKAIKEHSRKPLDVHLMITDPSRMIDEFGVCGAKSLTVHLEACTHLHRVIHRIKKFNISAGVAINPHTPVSALEEIIGDLDLVCVMGVNPGFGGQTFIQGTISKIRRLKELIRNSGSSALIEIDGGVDLANASSLVDAGADILVAGNAVFSHPSPADAISELKSAGRKQNII